MGCSKLALPQDWLLSCVLLAQITPLLSMLREIQSQHRQASSDAKKLPEEPLRYNLPAQVHLMWAVRNRDELQLLDQDLLDTAGWDTLISMPVRDQPL